MRTNTTKVPFPTVHLTVKKSRRKQNISKSQLIYYLENGEEFELEFFNPTQVTYKANIFMNDILIAGGGLVLKPGERVFLDRYLNDPRKFKFETYVVGTSESVNHAIANNGKVRVQFYKETQPFIPKWQTTTILYNDWNDNINDIYHTGSPVFGGCTTTDLKGVLSTNTSGNTFNTTNMAGATSNTSGVTLDWMDNEDTPNKSPLRGMKSKKQETGTVGKGSKSDQTFERVELDFDYSPVHTIEFQILPLSKKQTMVSDINSKRYCTQCGTKYKSNHKFCSNCGNKI